MKKLYLFITIGLLAFGFGCKGKGEPGKAAEGTAAPAVSEGYATVADGVELWYKTVGDGPEVVIVPAGIYMEYEFERLADESRTLVFYDQRGRGRSSAVADPSQISMAFEIADLEALRQHLGKEKVSLIGWSYLGGLVVLYAAQYPEHVNRIVQIGPISPTYEYFRQYRTSPRQDEVIARLTKMLEEGLDKADPQKYCTDYWNANMELIFYDPGKIGLMRSDRCDCENEMPGNVNMQLGAIIASLGEWDWREMAHGLDMPVLTVHGVSDLLPMEGSRVWVSSLGNARVLVVQEAGHLPFVEQPDVFYPAVDTFLKGEWPAGAEVFGAPIE